MHRVLESIYTARKQLHATNTLFGHSTQQHIQRVHYSLGNQHAVDSMGFVTKLSISRFIGAKKNVSLKALQKVIHF